MEQSKLIELAAIFDVDLKDPNNFGDIPVRCPFHEDTRASGSVNFTKQVYNCFAGCEGRTLEKAYADLFGEEPDGYTDEDIDAIAYARDDTNTNNSIINLDDIKDNNHLDDNNLDNNTNNKLKDFIKERRLSSNTLNHFNAYIDYNITSKLYGYLIFPNKDGFVARRFIDQEEPRYLNSKGHKNLFNLDAIDKSKDVILTEGLIDALTLHQLGFTNVVGSLGKSFSEKQAYSFRGKTVFILFDRDWEGFSGAIKAKAALKAVGAYGIILELPEELNCKDPNECEDLDKLKQWLTDKLAQYDQDDTKYVKSLFSVKPLKYLPTAFPKLNTLLGGGFKEGVHALAGMPGIGKSAICLEIAKTWAVQGYKGLYLTYEIPVRQCWSRILSMLNKPYYPIAWRDVEMNPSVVDARTQVECLELSKNLRIQAGWDIDEIIRASKNYEFIIIDYLQRMPGEGDERVKALKNIQGLGDLARDYGKIILCVSTIPRDKYNQLDTIAVFKETGNIEYAIQSGMVAYDKSNALLGLKIVKNTRGEENEVCLLKDLATDTFEEK